MKYDDPYDLPEQMSVQTMADLRRMSREGDRRATATLKAWNAKRRDDLDAERARSTAERASVVDATARARAKREREEQFRNRYRDPNGGAA